MKRIHCTVAAALIAAAFSSAALAQDKPTAPADAPNANKKVQAPDKDSVQHQQPTTENMDSNAQRQHSRSTPSAQSNRSAQGSRTQQAQVGEVRNWAAIDKNKDHLISPEEMEAALKSGKKTTKQ
jgi:hypothetical protein